MDEDIDTSVDTADMDTADIDTSSDIDTSDVSEDMPEDVPEDIPEDDYSDYNDDIEEEIPEDTEEDDSGFEIDDEIEDISDDIGDESDGETDDLPDEIPEDSFDEETLENNDTSDELVEDIEENELTDTDDDLPDEIPEDTTDTEEAENISVDVSDSEVGEEPTDTEGTFADEAGDTYIDVTDTEIDEQLTDNDETVTDETEDALADVTDTEADEQSADTEELVTDETEDALADVTDTEADEQSADTEEPVTDETEDALADATDAEADEQFADTEETVMDETEDAPADVADAEADEQPADTNEAVTDENEDAPTDVDDTEADEQPADTDETVMGEVENATTDGTDLEIDDQSANTDETVADEIEDTSLSKKRSDYDVLISGNDAINQRLEAQADEYRDQGLSEDEIKDKLASDKWNFQKEFLEDAFPGQDVSPNVFNGFNKNGAKDRITEIESSNSLYDTVKDDNDYSDTYHNDSGSASSDVTKSISETTVFNNNESVSDYNQGNLSDTSSNKAQNYEPYTIDTDDTQGQSDLNEQIVDCIPESRKEAIDFAYKDAPDEFIRALNDCSSEMKPIQDTGYSINEYGETVKDGCYYSPYDGSVHMDELMSDDEYAEVLPHEMTHFMDDQRGWESRNDEFVNAVNADIASMNRNTPEGRQRFNDMLDDAFNTGACDDRNVSDIISAMFGENGNDAEIVQRFNMEGTPFYTHDDTYWTGTDADNVRHSEIGLNNRLAEIYANHGAITVSNDRISNNFLERWFGNTYNQFNKFYGINRK